MLSSSAPNEAVTAAMTGWDFTQPHWSGIFSGNEHLMKSFILIKVTWKIILCFCLL